MCVMQTTIAESLGIMTLQLIMRGHERGHGQQLKHILLNNHACGAAGQGGGRKGSGAQNGGAGAHGGPDRDRAGKSTGAAGAGGAAELGTAPAERAWCAGTQNGALAAAPGGLERVGAGKTAAAEGEAAGGLPEQTLRQCLADGRFWLLWSTFFTGMGAGFCFLNNLAQMVEALGGPGPEQALAVLLFTSASTVGRITAGCLTERLLHRYGVARCARRPATARARETARSGGRARLVRAVRAPPVMRCRSRAGRPGPCGTGGAQTAHAMGLSQCKIDALKLHARCAGRCTCRRWRRSRRSRARSLQWRAAARCSRPACLRASPSGATGASCRCVHQCVHGGWVPLGRPEFSPA